MAFTVLTAENTLIIREKNRWKNSVKTFRFFGAFFGTFFGAFFAEIFGEQLLASEIG